jgi:acetyl esterase/lipase
VSAAYRFAPFAGLDEMKQDGIDAFEWCRSNLSSILSDNVDIDSCVLIGESAGGTIVSVLAHHLSPMPKAMVNIYGPTDFTDPHYSPTTPPNAIDIQPLTDKWSEEECAQGIKSRDLSKAITVCPYVFDIPVQQVRDQWSAPDFEYTEAQRFNWEIKRYMRTNKLLFKVILRTDQMENEEKELEVFKAKSPLHMLDGKKKGEYPPTWFLHGDSDGVVPIAQAERMQEKLKSMGIETGTSYEPGQGHEFDNKYTVCRYFRPEATCSLVGLQCQRLRSIHCANSRIHRQARQGINHGSFRGSEVLGAKGIRGKHSCIMLMTKCIDPDLLTLSNPS